MNTEKLYNTTLLLIEEEEKFSIGEKIGKLSTAISQNIQASISTYKNELDEDLVDSFFNNASLSIDSILREIGALKYFGKGAQKEIDDILLKNPYNPSKTINDLKEYQASRESFLETLHDLSSNLEFLGFEPLRHDTFIFEVGILLPTYVTDNRIPYVSKQLVEWNKTIKVFKELCGEPLEDVKISYTDNGSLDFFSAETVSVASCLALVIDKVANVYKKILEIKEAKEKLKKNGINLTETDISKQEKKLFDSEMDNLAKELIKSFAAKTIEKERLNEIKVAVKNRVIYVAKQIDKGILIEIIPPELTDEINEDDSEETKTTKEKDYKQKIQKIDLLQKQTELIKGIGEVGKGFIDLIAGGKEEEEQNTES